MASQTSSSSSSGPRSARIRAAPSAWPSSRSTWRSKSKASSSSWIRTSGDRMKRLLVGAGLAAMFVLPLAAQAQVAVTSNPKHELMLASPDPKLAANKRLVYDFWREVFEGGHMELAEKYMAESYIQHNPNVPTGRKAFIEFFSKFAKPKPIEPRVKAPLVAIAAESNLVIL